MSLIFLNKYIEDGYNYTKEEDAILKETQQKLKDSPQGELLTELLNNVAQSMAEDKKVVSNLCKKMNEWIVESESNNNEVFALEELPPCIKMFINQVKNEDDYCKGYVFKDGIINIWLVVDEADYESSTKYIRKAREIMSTQYKNIDLMIYSKDEVEEVLEELNGSGYKYKEI